MAILSMIMVDSYLICKRATGQDTLEGRHFFADLATGLIDNQWDVAPKIGRAARIARAECKPLEPEDEDAPLASTGSGLHLTPLKEVNKRGHTSQQWCAGKCGKKVVKAGLLVRANATSFANPSAVPFVGNCIVLRSIVLLFELPPWFVSCCVDTNSVGTSKISKDCQWAGETIVKTSVEAK